MKIKLYGTAAAEGIPALFCNCEVCLNAQDLKGKDVRTRTQALVDDTVLIDFPGDTYYHKAHQGLPLTDLEHLVITHSHHDHFFPEDLMMRLSAYANEIKSPLTVYGSNTVKEGYERAQGLESKEESRLKFQEVFEYEDFNVSDYVFTPLVANHGNNETCFLYEIKRNGKNILFAHDTGAFVKSVWTHWKEHKPYFDLIIFDCTHQSSEGASNHMGFKDNLAMREIMLKEEYVDDKTQFVLTHFSHNGGLNHKEINEWADEHGFICAYDGIEIEV